MKLKELVEKRKKTAARIQELRDKFHKNGKKWTDAEERKGWDDSNKEYDSLTKQIDEAREARNVERRAEQVREQQRESRNRRTGIPGREDYDPRDRRSGRDGREDGDRRTRRNPAEIREQAIGAWFRRQAGFPLTREQRAACQQARIEPSRRSLALRLSDQEDLQRRAAEMRARHPSLHTRNLSTGSASAGPTIPQGFIPRLEDNMLAFGGMLQVAEIFVTESGNSLPHPTADDTSNEGAILAEATSVGDSVDPDFDEIVLGAFKFSSKLVKVSAEILEDSAFDLAGYLSRKIGERLGRALNRKTTVGAGTTEPLGIVPASPVGRTADSATVITGDDFIRLVHSVDPAYRSSPGVRFMMHDSIMLEVRLLKDGNDQYLWRSGLEAGVADRLLGYPVTPNQHMASTLAASNSIALFGDLSKYMIRMVRGMRFKRLVERYADTDEEGFIGFLRADGNLIDAGTGPVKKLNMAAA